VLFVGLMIDAEGAPWVVEFNVRFGDPETQPLMLRLQSDLVPLLDGAARGTLGAVSPPQWGDAAVCVVLASGGYPREFRKGLRIEGLDAATADSDAEVFHAGTKRDSDGHYVTSGGRVLGVTARGETIEVAAARAYAAADRIAFDGVHLRRDIAARARAVRASTPRGSKRRWTIRSETRSPAFAPAVSSRTPPRRCGGSVRTPPRTPPSRDSSPGRAAPQTACRRC
jgi:phosphoribosylamine-glycine ligase